MKLAIIGAGTAGLASLKYGIDEGHECDAYERTGDVGGLWVYRDEVVDENGLATPSPMYKGLCTNIPKETMTYLDFPYQRLDESYPEHFHVLEYLQRFSNHFDLDRYIKFYSCVTQVKLIENEKWSLTIKNIKTKKEECKEYDAVFVCNGHHSIAYVPDFPGQAIFKGTQIHSVNFRKADEYKEKRVLMVGGFASALDIAEMISKVSPYIYVSYSGQFIIEPTSNFVRKPAVSRFEENGVVFMDESRESIDAIIYCTGYKYDFPFLTESCGIQVDNKWVKPLYKHVINIEHSTMYFIGLLDGFEWTPTCDLQARFALASLKQHFCLPTKEDMKKELDEYIMALLNEGFPISYAHRMLRSGLQGAYFQDLATTANIRPIPNVISKIHESVVYNKNRSRHFTIVDDENFTSA